MLSFLSRYDGRGILFFAQGKLREKSRRVGLCGTIHYKLSTINFSKQAFGLTSRPSGMIPRFAVHRSRFPPWRDKPCCRLNLFQIHNPFHNRSSISHCSTHKIEPRCDCLVGMPDVIIRTNFIPSRNLISYSRETISCCPMSFVSIFLSFVLVFSMDAFVFLRSVCN